MSIIKSIIVAIVSDDIYSSIELQLSSIQVLVYCPKFIKFNIIFVSFRICIKRISASEPHFAF